MISALLRIDEAATSVRFADRRRFLASTDTAAASATWELCEGIIRVHALHRHDCTEHGCWWPDGAYEGFSRGTIAVRCQLPRDQLLLLDTAEQLWPEYTALWHGIAAAAAGRVACPIIGNGVVPGW